MEGSYAACYARSTSEPEAFWRDAARGIDWTRFPSKILDTQHAPLYRWFSDGEMNTCWNALDRHVEAGRGDRPAILYESAIRNVSEVYSYRRLRDDVAKFAGALRDHGVAKGDRVLVYMPMVPEGLIAMLATARIGAVHSTVFGGFAANELAKRINDSGAKLIVTASCGIEPRGPIPYLPIVDEAIRLADLKPETVIVLQRPEHLAELQAPRDVDWQEATARARPADCVPVGANDPLYTLYTSGTTGAPKGVVRDNGGHAVALNWSMRNIFGMTRDEVFWAASDIGWQVGHSYTLYGPLLAGCASVLFEGKPVGTPDAATFWRVIAKHRVSILQTAPTAIRAIRRDDPEARLVEGHDLSSLRAVFLAGERSDSETLHWAENNLKVPVVDHWWQTETGWPITANPIGIEHLPTRYGSVTVPVPGWRIEVVNPETGHGAKPGDVGALVVRLPLPPGAMTTLWNADQRFIDTYLSEFPGYYLTGDAGMIDADGYVWVMSRTDDVINVAAHRFATTVFEEIMATHPDVAESAVIGAADALRGQVPLGLLVLKSGVKTPPDQVAAQVASLILKQIGPVACFKTAVVVDRLPKTRSGKILRSTIQKIADGLSPPVPATIDDPAILPEIRAALQTVGYAKQPPVSPPVA